MRKLIAALVVAVALPGLVALPADAEGEGKNGSFAARALPFPAMKADIYYPGKESCLGGMDGVHKVAQPFKAPGPGVLNLHVNELSGDWDIYALTPQGERLRTSEKAQVLDGADGAERLTVGLKGGQEIQMVACNWLGEPEITVHFDFVAKKTEAKKPRPRRKGPKRATHKVNAAGGPVWPQWQWDPDDVEIFVRDRVVWLNETDSTHHMTPYAGPWKNVATKHLEVGGKARFVFRKPGEYLFRCDFGAPVLEHSRIVGDDCIGQCGRIVVKRRRR